ncbi:hypothetical protein B0H99_103143 [Planomicrobium soli]|uniref:Lipoprotein n=1 Tax=Planomicrobium soli TaxID=1176648 RepID=A0A2P8H478_9BACL|nr:hypothetical protein [Planomicrobium soli]PSL41009.1 hypothetical protein B0H99_103143 [Planomicrobium soli]
MNKRITIAMCMVFFFLNGCANNSVEQIQADYIDIAYGDSLYEGKDKVEKSVVQSVVAAYNELEYAEQTSEDIDYSKAITLTFIHQDKISGILVMDDKGVFQTKHGIEKKGMDIRYIHSGNDIHEQALKIYETVQKQY